MTSIIRTTDSIRVVKTWIPFWEFSILTLALLSIVAIKNLYRNAQDTIKTNLLKEHLQEVEKLMVVLQSQKHEFRRHLQALQSMIHLNRDQDAKRYIDGIAEDYWNTDEGIYIPHPALNSLINSKSSLARSQGIDFNVSSINEFAGLKVEPWDLCSIVGNILDNAIESALRSDRQPWVEVELGYQAGFYIFCIRNNGDPIGKDEKERIFDAGYNRNNLVGRGYGLYIVRKLLERYGGTAEVISDKETTFIVKIPGEEKSL
jgi:Signal transduction histidine kinase regulating citrate/malate metabolism